jgi:hypothetical protein
MGLPYPYSLQIALQSRFTTVAPAGLSNYFWFSDQSQGFTRGYGRSPLRGCKFDREVIALASLEKIPACVRTGFSSISGTWMTEKTAGIGRSNPRSAQRTLHLSNHFAIVLVPGSRELTNRETSVKIVLSPFSVIKDDSGRQALERSKGSVSPGKSILATLCFRTIRPPIPVAGPSATPNAWPFDPSVPGGSLHGLTSLGLCAAGRPARGESLQGIFS